MASSLQLIAAGLVVLAPLVMTVDDASAATRINATNMSCANLQAVLGAQGGAVVSYRSMRTGGALYERFVRNRNFCQPGETAKSVSVPTADQASCPVRKCIESIEAR
ncbi:hypothetical protein KEU06_23265 [Pseudaminobacter sp. 19-2017]|uniref:Uncharacterized protein n=1 Tax=Pseudaminobacter soli (ex Zhang et al. 2022) TaxID=2831468 RepID=A0A942I3N3_9HYPH|nr:hypothetical protein [Pseudaminobacter soli]MBS3651542.1 hypothetical protein [Pseudaminobacter soli]